MFMHFIMMDLIVKFKLSPQGYQYVFTVIDMLVSYAWYIPLYVKGTDEVVHLYLVNIYSEFGGSHKILLDDGTEFKSKLFMQVSSTLEMKQVLSSADYPCSSGHIENVNNFLKMSI